MKLKMILLLLLVGGILSQESNDSLNNRIDQLSSHIQKMKITQDKLDNLIQTNISDNNSINSDIELIENNFNNSITQLNELINQTIKTNNLRFDALDNNLNSVTDSLLTTANSIYIMKDKKSFGEAHTLARLTLGANQYFEWRGKKYSTNYDGENKPPPTIEFLENLRDSIRTTKLELDGAILELDDAIIKANTLINDISSNVDQKYQTMDETISNRTLYSIIVILVILILFIAFFVFFKLKMGEQIDSLSSIRNTQEKLESEAIDLDKKLLQILEQKLEIANLEPQETHKLDHSLPLTLGSEIHRMRKRLKTMDESQGTKVLNKRIESLEEKLHDMGYEIVNLEGQPFNDGMTVEAQFIPDENLKEGESIINRVIKPQINYGGKLIQAAEVEVSQGI